MSSDLSATTLPPAVNSGTFGEGFQREPTRMDYHSDVANEARVPWIQEVYLGNVKYTSGAGGQEPNESDDVLYGEDESDWAEVARRTQRHQWDEDHADGSEGW